MLCSCPGCDKCDCWEPGWEPCNREGALWLVLSLDRTVPFCTECARTGEEEQ